LCPILSGLKLSELQSTSRAAPEGVQKFMLIGALFGVQLFSCVHLHYSFVGEDLRCSVHESWSKWMDWIRKESFLCVISFTHSVFVYIEVSRVLNLNMLISQTVGLLCLMMHIASYDLACYSIAFSSEDCFLIHFPIPAYSTANASSPASFQFYIYTC
jgi:hypothetical protein